MISPRVAEVRVLAGGGRGGALGPGGRVSRLHLKSRVAHVSRVVM